MINFNTICLRVEFRYTRTDHQENRNRDNIKGFNPDVKLQNYRSNLLHSLQEMKKIANVSRPTLGSHPAFYPMGTVGCYPEGKAAGA